MNRILQICIKRDYETQYKIKFDFSFIIFSFIYSAVIEDTSIYGPKRIILFDLFKRMYPF